MAPTSSSSRSQRCKLALVQTRSPSGFRATCNVTIKTRRPGKKPELSSKSADGPQDVVEVQSDFTRAPGEDPQREVDYYFSLRSSAFRLLLLYWKDDTQGQHFQSIAETLLRTIRSH